MGLFVLVFSSAILAQAEGFVESIGLNGYYRPDCWVPMTVQLRPTSASAVELQIRVIQEDLDRDRVIATRDITLTPGAPSQAVEPQRFWMYFRPQASNNGLSDASIGGSVKELSQQLKVVVTRRNGEIVNNLAISQPNLKRVEVGDSGRPEHLAPVRLILCVSEGGSPPAAREYAGVDGLSAAPMFISVRPRDLPEDSRGFEMLDGILWMNAVAPDPKRSLEEPRFRAIEQYVRQGGLLVVCQGQEIAKTRGFEEILPVKVTDYRDSADLQPLPQMGNLDWSRPSEEATEARRVAVATAKSDSVIVRQKSWGEGFSPFLVRGKLGSGCVTWVAQDLGDASTVRVLRRGWVRIWDEVFGWRNSPMPGKTSEDSTTAFSDSQGVVDIGKSFESRRGGLGTTASGFVLLAVAFFAIYWVAAGPGLYAYLSVRKLATLNWYLFGAIAVAAALLAAIVVRIVQSRAPELEHVTIVRSAPGENTTIQSRIGLYVPSAGSVELQMTGTAPQTTNWITPYPEHPARQAGSSEFLAMKEYTMPIVDSTSDQPITVSIPWRGTMKWLQVRWNGELAGRIDGRVFLTDQREVDIGGTLVNGTQWDLKEIYLAYHAGGKEGDGSNAGGDRVIYIPKWAKGQTIDLGQLLSSDKMMRIGEDARLHQSVPGKGEMVQGGIELVHRDFGKEVPLGEGWVGFWYAQGMLQASPYSLTPVDDSSNGHRLSLPLCSLFDRIPPMRNTRASDNTFKMTRRQIARVNSRFLNLSPALAAGNLVVLAEASGPLPVPFTVGGDTPQGDGVIICQYVLPLGRAGLPAVEK